MFKEIKPSNSAEEMILLGQKYGFYEKLNEKMSFKQYLTFLENTVNLNNKNMNPSDIAKLVSFCRRETYIDIIGVIKGIQNNDNNLLIVSKKDADVKIQSVLAMCYGSLTSLEQRQCLKAMNKFDYYLKSSDVSHSNLLKQAKITLTLV